MIQESQTEYSLNRLYGRDQQKIPKEHFYSHNFVSARSVVCVPDPNIIWVCESPAITLYSDVAIFPRFGGKRDVTHLIYVKIKPYLISLLFLAKVA